MTEVISVRALLRLGAAALAVLHPGEDAGNAEGGAGAAGAEEDRAGPELAATDGGWVAATLAVCAEQPAIPIIAATAQQATAM